MQRRLTTILTADVVGYSRMMEADEATTHARWQNLLVTHIEPQLETVGGRIVKRMGDGLLVEFASVVAAVQSASAIQKSVDESQADHTPETRIALRIGVHLGDVISENGDIFGDAVNVAARLETLAEPGAICVSRQVLDHIEKQISFDWKSLGPCQVKGLTRPIEAFIGHPTGITPASKPQGPVRRAARFHVLSIIIFLILALVGGGLSLWNGPREQIQEGTATPASRQLGNLPSLAVLPFSNLSSSADDDYIANGIADDLITDLARIKGLVVIARSSSFAFRGATSDTDIAQELDVRYIVSGSLRKSGNRIRINAQLIDAKSGAHVWAERYDRTANDIFELQDDVREQIVSALKITLTPQEREILSSRLTTSPVAYDLYLQARQQESFFTRASVKRAVELYREALAIDSEFFTAKARLASAYTVMVEDGWADDPIGTLLQAEELAKDAVAKANLPIGYFALARVYTRSGSFDGQAAIEALENALRIDPNYADAYAMLANTQHLVGQPAQGLANIETAMRLNPRFPFWYLYVHGTTLFHLNRFQEAEESFLATIERNPQWQSAHFYLVSTYGHLDRANDAEWELEELATLGFQSTPENWRERNKLQAPQDAERFFEGLRKAGVLD